MTNRKRDLLQDATGGTGFARRQPAVDPYDFHAGLRRHLMQDVHKLGKAQVGDLPPPQPLHTLQVQGLQADAVEAGAQRVRQLPMRVSTLIRNTSVRLCQPSLSLLPIVRPFLLAAQLPVQAGNFVQFGLEKLRAVVLVTLVVGQERFQPKVEAAAVTRAGSDWFGRFPDHGEANPQIAPPVPLDRHRLDVARNRPGERELVRGAVDENMVSTCVLPACLLEGEARVLPDLLEARPAVSVLLRRRTLSPLVGKEAPVGFVLRSASS